MCIRDSFEPDLVVRLDRLDQTVMRDLVPSCPTPNLRAHEVVLLELVDHGVGKPTGPVRAALNLIAQAVRRDEVVLEPGADRRFVAALAGFRRRSCTDGFAVVTGERLGDGATRVHDVRADDLGAGWKPLPQALTGDLEV